MKPLAKCFQCGLAALLSLCLCASSFAEQVTLNFTNADLKAVINTVSDLTGKTFIVDPRVKGTVNVISSASMPADAVYETFLSILQVHGYTTVDVGNVIKIIPDTNSRTSSQPVSSSSSVSSNDEFITHVVSLKHVTAQELVPILRPLIDKNGHLAAYAPSNNLILSDRASNIQRLLTIVQRVDKNSEQEIEVIPLKHALGSEIIRLLEKLSPPGGAKGANAVTFGVDERTNSILISGNRGKRLELRTLVSHLDTPISQDGNTQVIYLRYAKATNVAKILSGVSAQLDKQQGSKSPASENSVDIQADEESNALVITAPAAQVKALRSVIQKLDIPRAQVHIEAIIAEVSFSTALELGFEWLVSDASNQDNLPAAGTNFQGTLSALASDNLPVISTGLNVVIGHEASNGTTFGGVLRALATDGSTNILSTPSLMTLDNQEAEIIVAQNVPFITGSFTTSASGANNPFQTVERKDVGITLKVKPQINEGDSIMLEIEQDSSSVSPSTTTATDLITNKRNIKTTVMVPNGQMIVLGGLIDEADEETLNKVPLLGSIPLLGRLFSYERDEKLKKTLMVFIRPVIMQDAILSRKFSESKYSLLKEEQRRINAGENILSERVELPDFPEKFIAPEPVVESPTPSGEGN